MNHSENSAKMMKTDPEIPNQQPENLNETIKRDWRGICIATSICVLLYIMIMIAVLRAMEPPRYLVFSEDRFENMEKQYCELIERAKIVQQLLDHMKAIEKSRKVMQLETKPGQNWDKWVPIPSKFVGFDQYFDRIGFYGNERNFLRSYAPNIDDVSKEFEIFPFFRRNLNRIAKANCEKENCLLEKFEIKEGHMFVHLTMWEYDDRYEMTLVYKSILADA